MMMPDAELAAIYPGFTIEQIKAGLYTPATTKDREASRISSDLPQMRNGPE